MFVFIGLFLIMSTNIYAQNSKQRKKIVEDNNKARLVKMQKEFQHKRQKMIRIAKEKGWETTKKIDENTTAILDRIVDGKPTYTALFSNTNNTTGLFNAEAGVSTRVNHLQPGGSLGLDLTGSGITAYVWDGSSARATHQEFVSNGISRVNALEGEIDGFNGAGDLHATHVTGTIIAAGVDPKAKGMATGANAIGYNFENDAAEAIGETLNGMLLSNHSYGTVGRVPLKVCTNGYSYYFGLISGCFTEEVIYPNIIDDYRYGSYSSLSREWDEIMYNAPNYLMVISAGNDGLARERNDLIVFKNGLPDLATSLIQREVLRYSPVGGYNGYDKLIDRQTAKNNLVVANAQDANIDASGNLISVSINNTSSQGPTDDFRIKPDITGNGTNVFSTAATSDDAYATLTGTSMSSPNVTGALMLLQEHYKNLNNSYMKAATLKGLALHTADDMNSEGPDAVSGWGLLNAKNAAEVISNNEGITKIQELTLSSGQTYTFDIVASGKEPLMASISWTDLPGTVNNGLNSSQAALINDLDIRISKDENTYFPYKLTAPHAYLREDNAVDPYERIDISNPSGRYTVTITHKGNLETGTQNYSLIISGLANPNCIATTPTNISINNITSTDATINWASSEAEEYNIRYRDTATSNWSEFTTNENTASLNGLSSATTYEVQLNSKCTYNGKSSSYSSPISFTTSSQELVNGGTYRILNKNAQDYLDANGGTQVGANLHLWEYADVPQQKITATYDPNKKTYTFIAKGNGNYALDLSGGTGYSGANIKRWHINGHQAQDWILEPTSDGYYYVISKLKGSNGEKLYLEVNNAGTNNGANIVVKSFTGNPAQEWKFIPISSTATKTINTVTNSTNIELSLFPNPVKDYLNVQTDYTQRSNFRILNVLGQTFKSGKINNTPSPINVSNLQEGIYLFEITNGQKRTVKKFIKR